MAVIQGVITDYQTSTHTVGTPGEYGMVASFHISSFQINGQVIQLQGNTPAGLFNGDTARVTGELNNCGIFEALYYFNSTRKCYSPPPSLGSSRFVAWAFLCIGAAIFLACLAYDLTADTVNRADTKGFVVMNVVAGLLGLVFWGFGQRWHNGLNRIKRGYQEFISHSR